MNVYLFANHNFSTTEAVPLPGSKTAKVTSRNTPEGEKAELNLGVVSKDTNEQLVLSRILVVAVARRAPDRLRPTVHEDTNRKVKRCCSSRCEPYCASLRPMMSHFSV